MTNCDVAVVGAGAAGLMAAIFAARAGARTVALDGAKKIGAKILISGGGRCNVTHDVVHPEDFHGSRKAIAKVLRTFDVEATVKFFEELGVRLKREETGKLFPVGDRARTVVDALLQAAEGAGVVVMTDARVTSISSGGAGDSPAHRRRVGGGSTEHGFVARTASHEIHASRLILATGGRSVPKTGSDGFGYTLATSLGHSISHTFPALVPLILEEGHWLTSLSGTSVEAELAVRSGTGRVLHRERGSMLFTHFGLSGPVVLDISRHWIALDTPRLTANFLPGETFESLDRALIDVPPRRFLRGRIPERLADAICGDAPLTKDERRRIVRSLLELPLPVIRDRGFDYAEVTAGGVPLTEIDVATMESRLCPGLYLCGEILDVDGRIGGYNFQWAWASGRLAGTSASRALHNLSR